MWIFGPYIMKTALNYHWETRTTQGSPIIIVVGKSSIFIVGGSSVEESSVEESFSTDQNSFQEKLFFSFASHESF